MNRRAAVLFAILTSLVVFVPTASEDRAAQASGSAPDAMTVDMDVAGNTASGLPSPHTEVLGSVDRCVSATAGTSIVIDVTVTNVPMSHPMKSFGFALLYNSTYLSVTAADAAFMARAKAGSSIVIAGDETALPDSDGSFFGAVADTGPSAASEDGSGVLERLTISISTATPTGLYDLTLDITQSGTIDPGNLAWPPDAVFNGKISVGADCPGVKIDMDPSSSPANTATSLGSVQRCAVILNDDILNGDEDSIDAVEFDVAVGAGTIPPANDMGTPGDPSDDTGGLVSFSYNLSFAPVVARVLSVDSNIYLASAAGSSLAVLDNGGANPGQTFPNASGLSSPAVADTGPLPGSVESGPGVLSRITIEGTTASPQVAGTGLVLSYVGLFDVGNQPIDPVTYDPSFIVLNQADGCTLDADGDVAPDAADNCPSVSNLAQINSDSDPLGDFCDNCPTVPNTGQDNNDGDLLGDVCDSDDDNDTVPDAGDNCQMIANPGQENADGDGMGDACDPDDDNDSVLDGSDNCPKAANPGQQNADADPPGDACDNCPTTDNADQANSDGDGLGNACDNCPTTTNPTQANFDGDALGDACDPDDDNDGVTDTTESTCGSNPVNGASTVERVDGVFAGVDDDGDASVDEVLPAGAVNHDCDGDGYAGASENNVYSPGIQGDQDPCGTAPGAFPFNTPIGWPADLWSGGVPDSTNRITLLDLTSFLGPVRYFNTDVGSNPGDRRWDLVPGRGVLTFDINLQDLTSVLTLFPPMLGGARAFNGPSCPYPP